MGAFAAYAAHLGPAVDACWQLLGAALDIALGHEADEHAIDIARVHGVARQAISRLERRERQFDQGVVRRAAGIIPQSDIPGARIALGVAALDRQRRAMRLVEHDHPAAAPAKFEDAMRVITLRLIGEQGMVQPVFALPDQSR